MINIKDFEFEPDARLKKEKADKLKDLILKTLNETAKELDEELLGKGKKEGSK